MKRTTTNAGFTLWELLVTLTIASILIGFGLPSFRDFQRDNAIAAASNSLVTAMLAGRTEAIKRQVPVTVCASPNPAAETPACSRDASGTSGGYIVWVDENGNTVNGAPVLTDVTDGNAVVDANETILLRVEAPAAAIDVRADSGYLTFRPSGYATTARGAARPPVRWILFCDDRGNRASAGGSTARVIRIDPTGRSQVLRDVGLVDEAIGELEDAGVTTDCD